MAKDIILREEERTVQMVGGQSKAVIVPSEIAENLELKVSDVVVVREYIKYKRDKNGSIICDKDGQPLVEHHWGAFWKKGR